MAATATYTVTSTAMTGSDVDITLPSTSGYSALRAIVVQPIGGNVSFKDASGNAFTMQSGQSYPFEDPSLAGKVLTFNGGGAVTVQIINWFGLGR